GDSRPPSPGGGAAGRPRSRPRAGRSPAAASAPRGRSRGRPSTPSARARRRRARRSRTRCRRTTSSGRGRAAGSPDGRTGRVARGSSLGAVTVVAVVGLGAMGSRIARRLLDAGHEVVVWNRTAERAAPLVEAGATAAATPAEAARRAEVVVTMVADPAALRDVTEGPEGTAAGVGAEGLGLSRAKAFEVLAATPLAGQAERRREAIEGGEYPPRFTLYLARKDAELVVAAAEEAGVDLRLTDAARRWLADADEAGWGDRDYSAVLAW